MRRLDRNNRQFRITHRFYVARYWPKAFTRFLVREMQRKAVERATQ